MPLKTVFFFCSLIVSEKNKGIDDDLDGSDDKAQDPHIDQAQDDEESVGPQPVVLLGGPFREEPHQDPASVERRHRDEVEDNEVSIHQDAVKEDDGQALQGMEAAGQSAPAHKEVPEEDGNI